MPSEPTARLRSEPHTSHRPAATVTHSRQPSLAQMAALPEMLYEGHRNQDQRLRQPSPTETTSSRFDVATPTANCDFWPAAG